MHLCSISLIEVMNDQSFTFMAPLIFFHTYDGNQVTLTPVSNGLKHFRHRVVEVEAGKPFAER